MDIQRTFRLYGLDFLKNRKENYFKNHPKTVIEKGSGSGANMQYFKKGTKPIAIEPNIHMHANLQKSADRYGIILEIKALIRESINSRDSSYDFVMFTLVLSTVENPIQCINQIKRILKPPIF